MLPPGSKDRMPCPPRYLVEKMPGQISAEVVALLEQAETATVGHWRHWGFVDRGIQGLLRRRVAGTAVTVQIPGPDSTLLHHALGLLRPGDILVVDRLGDNRHACWGGGVTVAAKAAGARPASSTAPAPMWRRWRRAPSRCGAAASPRSPRASTTSAGG
jgi:hypothetical protein